MKMRVIGLMALLFAGNVAAEEIFLTCQGYQANGEIVVRDARFNEEAGTWHFTNQDGEQEVEKVKFSEDKITGRVYDMDPARTALTLGIKTKLELNRYTGVLIVNNPANSFDATLQCQRRAQEKLF